MKSGAYFLNLGRGFVVDHDGLARDIERGQIAGAAVDVFPNEPEGRGPFASPLQNLSNVILTLHIGGSTEEAQQNIGQFVCARLVEYLRNGNTMLTVNLPHCRLEHFPGLAPAHAYPPECSGNVVEGKRSAGAAGH
jgi:D-3-phosphoglycerate dehydrogenase